MYIRMDELNKDYIEIIKKFKSLEREKGGLLRTIDELMKANVSLENDFKVVFRQA